MRRAAEERPKKQLFDRPTEDQSVVSQSPGPPRTGERRNEEMALCQRRKWVSGEDAILCRTVVVNGRISRGGESY